MIKDYWEEQHERNEIKMLTGTELNRYYDLFNIKRETLENKTVLEIGVGTGKATRAIGLLTDDFDVLDIADKAISKVVNWISEGYTDSKSLASNKYDVVISNLVAQHMSTEDLKAQMKDVIRSLKDTGVFFMQFSEAKGYNPETVEVQQGGGVLHSVNDMSKIVASCGGVMDLIQTIQILPIVKWHCVAIRRAA